MAVTLGTHLGRYEIVSLIGAGGMGEVYLALDAQLNRTVALKILPSDVASDGERMRRFIQEAKAAAALSHPNIAHIYEVGESEGTHFIAMEYIDGETLRTEIHRAKTPLNKLLKYLAQVAQGLAKAHAAGIVHRDLKPDNIMIARDGYAKILDFGLAKLIEPQKGTDGGSSEVATAILLQHSTPGMIMGTVGYMSPEQAQGRGKEIDHRSDIFSFGCILYEAATGRKAFEGKDVLDSLHKIVHAPTPQIRDVNADAPNEMQRIVRRCLAKEPEKRYQSIKEVAIELDELRQELKDKAELEYSVQPESSSLESVGNRQQEKTDSISPSAPNTRKAETIHSTSSAEYVFSQIKQHRTGAAIAVVFGLLAVSGIAFALYKFAASDTPAAPFQTTKITRLTATGKARGAAISPDGKYVAYVVNDAGQESVWIRQVATTRDVQIIPPEAGIHYGLAFSRDGNFIYYRLIDRRSGGLYQVPVLGGGSRRLLDEVDTGVAFSPDGKQIAFGRTGYPSAGETSLILANADGTGERTLATRQRPASFAWFRAAPAWSPDGKVIAAPMGGGEGSSVVEVQLADGTVRPLTSQKWRQVGSLAWLSDGSGLIMVASERVGAFQLWHLSYPGGETRRITNDANSYRSLSLTADTNTLVTVQAERLSSIWTVALTDGEAQRARQITPGKFDGEFGLAWTPDGRIIYQSVASGNEDLWIMQADGTDKKQLTVDPHADFHPTVTPDGRYILFSSDRGGRAHSIWRMDADGTNPKQLSKGGGNHSSPQSSPDGKWVVYHRLGGGSIWKVSIDGGEPVQLTEERAGFPRSGFPSVSPDGTLIACRFRDQQADKSKVALIPFAGGPPVKILDIPLADFEHSHLRWTPDGRALLYINERDGVSNIWSQPVDGSTPRQLTAFDSNVIYSFDLSRDGKQLAIARGSENSDVILIGNSG